MKIHSARFAFAAPNWDALPEPDRPEIAFAGRSNVGKSSLLNALIGRKNLARTSKQPGKTQAINFYLINADDSGNGGFYLVDLPGFGYAKVSKKKRAAWQRLVGRYVTERAETGALCAVVQLIDSRHPPAKMDEELMALLLESTAAPLIALTKSDKLSGNGKTKALAALKRHLAPYGIEVPIILTSAEKKQGLERLWEWIKMFL